MLLSWCSGGDFFRESTSLEEDFQIIFRLAAI